MRIDVQSLVFFLLPCFKAILDYCGFVLRFASVILLLRFRVYFVSWFCYCVFITVFCGSWHYVFFAPWFLSVFLPWLLLRVFLVWYHRVFLRGREECFSCANSFVFLWFLRCLFLGFLRLLSEDVYPCFLRILSGCFL